MFRNQFSLYTCLVVGGLGWIMAESAAAQSPDSTGIVRVTDSAEAANGAPLEEGGIPRADCPPGHGAGVYGYCPHGHRYGLRHGHHGLHGQPYGPIEGWGFHYWHGVCCPHCSLTAYRILDWFNPHGLGTNSPDHGWCPPAKRPLYRADVVYNKMYPDAWTGAAASHAVGGPRPPVVYTPTDTTQLGYYYQKVPYWTPQPGMIPPAPVPSQWHLSLCETGDYRHHPAGVVFGTAPRIAPTSAPVMAPQVIDQPAIPPAGELVNPSGGLERSAVSPHLLPIQN